MRDRVNGQSAVTESHLTMTQRTHDRWLLHAHRALKKTNACSHQTRDPKLAHLSHLYLRPQGLGGKESAAIRDTELHRQRPSLPRIGWSSKHTPLPPETPKFVAWLPKTCLPRSLDPIFLFLCFFFCLVLICDNGNNFWTTMQLILICLLLVCPFSRISVYEWSWPNIFVSIPTADHAPI